MILVAEDQVVLRDLYKLIFEKLKITLITAETGEEALKLALENPIELIFMDINMPGMTGYEVAGELRKKGFKSPIIAVTGGGADAEDLDRDRCKEAGIDDLLYKPVKLRDIDAMLSKWHITERKAPSPVKPGESPGGNKAFDSVYMLDTFLNNTEMANKLLIRFIERSKAQIESLEGKEKAGEEAGQIAHMLKGAAFTMGGRKLGEAAAALELAYQNGTEIEAPLSSVREAFDVFKKEAEDYLYAK
ncbi:MAG: response regulator [Treponema sp.]|nr:response regulator [Treponema sp.]